MRMRSLALLLVLLLPALAQAQLYRWVDDKGNVHFSDRAPLSGAKNVQKQPMPAGPPPTTALPYALQQAVSNFPVTLYTSDACKDTCARARELLDKRGVPYGEMTVADEADLAQLKKLSGDTVVPLMTVGRELHKGFEATDYARALDNANYPASSLLPPGVQARQTVAKLVKSPPPAPAPATAPAPAATEAEPAAAPQEAADTTAPK